MSRNPATSGAPAYDIDAIRADFPILSRTMHDKPLAFLDSAASAQKPRQVIDAVRDVYEREYANVHRGLYQISEAVTARYEGTRETIRQFINAAHTHEIIFTRNGTESINLVAYGFGRHFLDEGDEVIITELEHHANIVPWQMLRDEKGIVLKVAPVSDDGELIMSAFEELLGPKTKLVAVAHMSNVLGTVLPVEEITRKAHAVGAKVLLDGCQSVTHIPVDVQALGCDFYVFSGHKLYGPSGIGVLYGREEVLNAMPPFMGGGDMISSVTFEKTTWAKLPHKFEAGTPAIAQAIGLGAAIDYVNGIGLDAIATHEADLLNYATQKLASIDGLRIIGTAPNKASVVSFMLDFAHPHDVATIIDRAGVAVRAGHHCAQPLMDRMDVPATVRASIGLYNDRSDIDALVAALGDVQELFG
ncbi:MAG: cysteine desulfurase [Alphaproteobacteria bacterium]|nr:cysteine desulfurase [Alphaproteobacteria bacterium]|tara:strand:+ start:2496 stop:3746 length:1251 start_codon:yes stop_codon:yes gene_type:complete